MPRLLASLLLTLGFATLQAAEQGSPYWHHTPQLAAFPDHGELKVMVAISTIRRDDGTLADPVATWEDQNQDLQRTDERLRASSYGQAWYTWEIHPRPGEDPAVAADQAPAGDG